jgi:uncharacterized membrane protein YbhN (UPF0104 family)
MSDQPVTAGKPSLAVRIETEKSHPLAWKTVAKRAAVVVIAGVSLYLVFPAITEVLASWPRLSTLDPRWFGLAVAAEIAHFVCTFALQRLALRTRAWFPVVTSQLAGNAITLIMPGGAAVGAALQFRMLATSATLLAQRNEIRTVLGRQWWQALLLSAGRLAFDYLCLLAALRATGSRPRPSLILVAYAAAGIVGMIPATPGGLGIVEASLTGLLVLAQVDSSQAVLATLTYRLASYWVPLCAGPIAYGLFRIRYRNRGSPNKEAAAPA